MSAQALAAPVFDGTTGGQAPGSVAGSTIDVSQGTRLGGNVFHSFDSFSIDSGETLTFTDVAPSGVVDNLINRVTGTSISQINGTLASTVAGADVYLINPNGIVMAAGSVVDVPAGFHLSTADELRFADSAVLQMNVGSSTFTSAAPQAFGFTGAPVGDITTNIAIRGDQGADLSLVGGDITIQGAFGSGVIANGADVNIVSVAGAANVPIDPAALGFASAAFGDVSINASISNRSNNPAIGNVVVIRGDKISMTDASVLSDGVLSLLASSDISLWDTTVSGLLGEVTISATRSITLDHDSFVGTPGLSTFQSSDVFLTSDEILLIGGSLIASQVGGDSFNAGDVFLTGDTLTIDGAGSFGPSAILANALGLFTTNTGTAGTIHIDMQAIEIKNGGQLSATTAGDGNAGTIIVCCGTSFTVSGAGSLVTAGTAPGSTGDAGKIYINADSVSIANGGQMLVSTEGAGQGGEINIRTSQFSASGAASGIVVSGASAAAGAGAGHIAIEAGIFDLLGGAIVTTDTAGISPAGQIDIRAGEFTVSGVDTRLVSQATGMSGGNAGDITIGAYNITFKDGATLSTFSQSGSGGNIMIDWNKITTISGSTISTDVKSGSLDSGNIIFGEPLEPLGFDAAFLAFCNELLDIYKGQPKYDPAYTGQKVLVIDDSTVTCENSGGGAACQPPTPPNVLCIGLGCNDIDTTSTNNPPNMNTQFETFAPPQVIVVPERSIAVRCTAAHQTSALTDSITGNAAAESDPAVLRPAGLPTEEESATITAAANLLCTIAGG